MRSLLSLLLIGGIFSLYAQTSGTSIQPLTIGEVHTISSGILQEDRTLNIYLPATYREEKAYPVLYLLDGTINEDLLHVVGLVQFFNLMFQMPDVIVVGIANVDRKRDFTFHTDLKDLRKKYPTTGHSDAFIRFIAEELQPYIQQRFKTTDTRYLIGQSLGGLLASEILLKKPELFTHYFIISPSLWWDNESLLAAAPKLLEKPTKQPEYIYVSVGEQEDPIMQREAKQFYELLLKAKRKGPKITYAPMKEENHATILHRSIYRALLELFPYKDQ